MDPISPKAVLLQVLIQGDGYGLELIERVKTKTGGKLVLHQGTIYPALREMEKDGLVRSYEGEPLPERGGRPRRYYKITGAGRRVGAEDGRIIAGIFGVPVLT